MKKLFSAILSTIFLFSLTGCDLLKEKTAFTPLSEKSLETISGKLFPFSVSVATNATHRLEENGKLVGYIASDIIDLEKFENQKVKIDGIWRHEKMRQIFWAERIHIEKPKDEIKNKTPEFLRFKMKDFSFVYPSGWSHTISPDNKAYFIDKKDPIRQVFLTFSVEPFSSEETKLKPNMSINEFSGIKTITVENGTEKEKIILFSQKGIWKYIFKSQVKVEDFERKKEILKLIISFVEGEENVRKAIEEEQKKAAEKESEKIEINNSEKILSSQEDKNSEPETKTEKNSKSQKISKKTEIKNIEDISKKNNSKEKTYTLGDYEEKIDHRAYTYKNSYNGIFMKVPYGFWYRSLGAQYGSMSEIGIAKHPVNKYKDAEIFVKVFVIDKPLKKAKELVVQNRVILTKNRNKKTVYEVSGPEKYRNEIWSIFNSLK